MIGNVTSASLAATGLGADPKPAGQTGSARLHDTAQQFESLLLSQLLKSSREASGSGWLGTGDDDQAGETGIEVAEQEFARMLASRGGLGISRLIETGLQKAQE